MLWGGAADGGALELRRDDKGGIRVAGRFPYATETQLAPGRSEQFAARAFAGRIDAGQDIHFLAQHDYAHPLASRSAGTLTLRDGDAALEFEATITTEVAQTSWARDMLAALGAGLIRGLSPGFQVAPGGETVERRGDGLRRTVRAADLFELSAVTLPAYPAAQIEGRSWKPEPYKERAGSRSPLGGFNRWRP